MDWLVTHSEQLMAIVGLVFVLARSIVAMTPSDADDQLVNTAQSKWEKFVGVVAALLGLDTTQGVKKKK